MKIYPWFTRPCQKARIVPWKDQPDIFNSKAYLLHHVHCNSSSTFWGFSRHIWCCIDVIHSQSFLFRARTFLERQAIRIEEDIWFLHSQLMDSWNHSSEKAQNNMSATIYGLPQKMTWRPTLFLNSFLTSGWSFLLPQNKRISQELKKKSRYSQFLMFLFLFFQLCFWRIQDLHRVCRPVVSLADSHMFLHVNFLKYSGKMPTLPTLDTFKCPLLFSKSLSKAGQKRPTSETPLSSSMLFCKTVNQRFGPKGQGTSLRPAIAIHRGEQGVACQ